MSWINDSGIQQTIKNLGLRYRPVIFGVKKMSLTTEEVKRIAYLARLGIVEKDVETYAKDLSSILDLMTQMSETNTDSVKPMAHPMDQTQRLRADSVTETNQREHFQAIAPQVESGLYLVPKVID